MQRQTCNVFLRCKIPAGSNCKKGEKDFCRCGHPLRMRGPLEHVMMVLAVAFVLPPSLSLPPPSSAMMQQSRVRSGHTHVLRLRGGSSQPWGSPQPQQQLGGGSSLFGKPPDSPFGAQQQAIQFPTMSLLRLEKRISELNVSNNFAGFCSTRILRCCAKLL
jgi:hypothetical protein